MRPRLDVPPFWKILAPDAPPPEAGIPLVVRPESGFGDGSHETTRLCLRAVAMARPPEGAPWRVLDFGSGSGVLSIAAAKLGATAVGVEIDPAALAASAGNAALNGVADRVRFTADLGEAPGPFDVVIANILRPVLTAFADDLAARLAPRGALILSGLVTTDVPDLGVRYGALLGGRRPDVYSLGEWRALAWWPPTAPTSPVA